MVILCSLMSPLFGLFLVVDLLLLNLCVNTPGELFVSR